MEVTFANFGNHLASSRLRAAIPQRELLKLGVGVGNDVLVYGKHFIPMEQTQGFKKLVFDVCDDHFKGDLREYYLSHIYNANLVTCNSEAMRLVILEQTGRDAIVVHEPYECEEGDAAVNNVLYWFGHRSNLCDLERIAPELKHELIVLTNSPGYGEWNAKSHAEIMAIKPIVIIPTGKSICKSENRMVESIRRGSYVCAERLPAYERLRAFFLELPIPEHIEAVLNKPQDAVERIKAAQNYIKDRYSPKTIAKEWLGVLERL